MERLKQVLMERDGLTSEDADIEIAMAKDAVSNGENPEDVLKDLFGLEPDYFLDLVD